MKTKSNIEQGSPRETVNGVVKGEDKATVTAAGKQQASN